MNFTISKNSDFTLDNIPFGIFSTVNSDPRAGVAIGNKILDLCALYDLGLFPDIADNVFQNDHLNPFIDLGKEKTSAVRRSLQNWLKDEEGPLKEKDHLFIDSSEAIMHLPVRIGDYTDFYSSIEHATNVGMMFRDPENALLPNWKHLPVAYHGRSSSIIVSGTPIKRPVGQVLPKGSDKPVFSQSRLLDFELEMAFIVSGNTKLGESVPVNKAEDYIFGMVLFNDWSARDIQKWEYVPLGPFLGKNFASSISPWIVTMDALDAFRVEGPKQDSPIMDYLSFDGNKSFDIDLQVAIKPDDSEETIVCNSNFKYMYWNMSQQLAHHTVNGCNIRTGDMMGSGTLSGPGEGSFGSMLEISWAGSRSVKMKNGTERKFLQDHDEVIMRGSAQKNGKRIGFGELKTKIIPAD